MFKTYEEYAGVRLIAYTQADKEFIRSIAQSEQTLQDGCSALDLIAYCAKVSNPGNQSNTLTSERLVKYLVKHQHWSPLEMVDVVLEIDTTRDIGRQIIRHRSFVPQEFSQRYEDVTKSFDGRGMQFVVRPARRQDSKNRQNSVDDLPEDVKKTWIHKQSQLIHEARLAYQWAIENGIAKECARVVLPEGNTTTRLYFKGSIRSWIHYIDLRSGNGTQLEHIMIAKACAEAIYKVFPPILDFIQKEQNNEH